MPARRFPRLPARPLLVLCALPIVLAATLFVRSAAAADAKLDQAIANIEKAIELIKASENPGVTPPFNRHDLKAVAALQRAWREVEAAKTWADK